MKETLDTKRNGGLYFSLSAGLNSAVLQISKLKFTSVALEGKFIQYFISIKIRFFGGLYYVRDSVLARIAKIVGDSDAHETHVLLTYADLAVVPQTPVHYN